MSYAEVVLSMKMYLSEYRKLAKNNPEEAKDIARKSLIATGVLNQDGSPKENICNL